MKKFQLDQELRFQKVSARLANEDSRRGRSPSSRQQVIYQYDSFPCSDGIDVHLHFRFAVLERVAGNLSLERQLPALANRNETDTELIGDRRSKEKSARIDANDLVDLFPSATIQKQVNRDMKQSGIAQDRCNIFEYNTFLRKIGHIAYSGAQSFECVQGHPRER